MIDTPQNCLDRALASRTAAEGPMLENARSKHLASAAAWESLASLLQGAARARQVPVAPARPRRPGTPIARERGLPAFDRWENEGGSLHRRP
jgi:hypothetical protein